MNALARALGRESGALRQQLGEGDPDLLPLLGGENDGTDRGGFPTAGIGAGASPLARRAGGASGGTGGRSLSGGGGITPGSARSRFDLLGP